ncbi:MAG: hypothetical protein HKN91_01295 [Acidimicrobiia bacterium]|nr:hypothetical protein [Acidimicrobiia bacterium]
MLLQSLGDDYAALLDRHIEIIRDAVERFHGSTVSTHGDEVFAVFPSSPDALAAAVDTQRRLSSESWQGGAQVRVRIGLHTGRPRLREGDYVGLDVHRAARISAAGSGGQVLLSKETAEDVRAAGVPAGVEIREMGWHRLKDLRYPELLFDVSIEGQPAEFPTLSSLGQRPNNLKDGQTAFVGRSNDLASLENLVGEARNRLVTLTGIGGAGKTRLALAVGARLLDSFHEGVFSVSLAAIRDSRLVMPAVAHTLGIPEFPGMSVIETIKSRLATSEMLLILDNFEQVVDAAGEVAELLDACEKLQVIVTSREPLRVTGEKIWAVPPLAFPAIGEPVPLGDLAAFDSLQLFVERVRDFQPDFELTSENAEAVRAICTQLEGLPLAIELAASRVAVLTPAALLERLEQRGDVLTGGRRDADPRHQTINNMIDWSYELLSEEDTDLFDKLAVFAGSFTVEAAEIICAEGEVSAMNVLDGLQSLSAKSLLVAETVSGEPRVRMLQMIRNYARTKLDARADAEPLRLRHALHYVQILEEIAPELQSRGQKEFVVRLLDDADNFRASLEFALRQPTGELTGKIMASLLWFWVPHGWFTEGLSWSEQAVEQAADLESDYERAVIHDVIGWIKLFAGDYAGALPHCQTSLELFSKLDSESDIARTKMTLGITGAVTGELETGPELIMEALGMYQALDDPVGTALAFTALGEGARAGGDTAAAEECYQSALALVVDTGNVYWQGGLLNNLTHFRLHEGNWQAALEMGGEALKLGEEYDYPMVVNLSIAALGGVAVARGDGKLAAQLFGATDRLLSELGAVFEPLDLAELEQNTAAARELLSPEDYENAFNEGREWSLDEAISAALGQG